MTDDERRKYNRDWYANHREETCAYRRGRYRNPPPQNKEYTKRKFVLKTRICLGCGREYMPTGTFQKRCAECRPERKIASDKTRRIEHHEERVAYDRKYAIEHREERKLYARSYCAAHPEERVAINGKHLAKRRSFGFLPLNSWFIGCEGHHIDHDRVIFMPKTLHRSIYHNQFSGQGMIEMNALAENWIIQERV